MKEEIGYKNYSFDWNEFSYLIKKLIMDRSTNSIVPVNSDQWEEIISIALNYMKEDPLWIRGSHKPGADITCKKFSISAKSGSISNDFLKISSYRLTRFDNLKEMTNFMTEVEREFDFYLCCVRIDKSNGSRKYEIYIIPSNVFDAKSAEWKEIYGKKKTDKKMGWTGISKNGCIAEIRISMSNQLWLSIPLKLCKKLTEVIISKKDLGSLATKTLDN